jgi:putative hydrolase of the HAD superfamily
MTINSNGNGAPIRAVIFDYGEVLCHAPVPEILDRLMRMFRIDRHRFDELYRKNRLRYDRADLTAEEYWRHFAADAGVNLDSAQLAALRQYDLEMWSSINPAMLAWLGDLRSTGMKTAILSNMPAEMVVHVRKTFPWMEGFDCRVFSAELRRVKPEPEIYQHCLDCLRVAPQEALFIDDKEVNVKGARELGIRGIRMESLTQLSNELKALGFTPLPKADGMGEKQCHSKAGNS